MYLAVIGPTSNGYYTANLSRNVNGTWKQLYSHKYAGSVTNALMEFHVVGTSLRLYLNGVVVAFANDTLLTAAGSVGMRAKAGAIMRGFNAAATTLADPGFGFVDHFSTPGANGQLNEDWFNQAGNIGVNHGVATGAAAANVATVNGFTSADVTVQADFALTAVGQMAGLITRYSGSGDQNMYFARLAQTGTHTYQVALYVNVAGTWKVLKAQSVSTVTGTMRLTMSGSSMTISYNGAALFTVVDSSISAAGSVGLRMNAGATADNFSISQ
jgi:hypothetical protein